MIPQALIRLAKLVALFGFALPWFTVSCANQPLMTASGYQLVIGQEVKAREEITDGVNQLQGSLTTAIGVQAAEAADTPPVSSGGQRGWTPPPEVQAMAIAAAVFLAAGLVIGFVTRARVFAAVSAAGGLLGAGLAYGTVAAIDHELRARMAAELSNADNPLAGMGGSLFTLIYEPGLWVTVGGGVLAGLTALFLLLISFQPAATAAQPPSVS